MNRIIPVASGKGGVGKSFLTVNLGVTLARMGKTVILVDLDLGGSNLHTFLGIRNTSAGIGNYLNKQADSLESLVIPTGIDRLYFIPGDGLFTAAAQQHYFQKMKIIKELPGLVADYILLDLGAGTTHNIVDYFIPFPQGIVVTVPETTAILNAYSFLKTALSRSIYRSFPPNSEERELIKNFFKQRLEGSGSSLFTLADRLGEIDPEYAESVRDKLSVFYPGVIINMGRSSSDKDLGKKLRVISRKNLGISLQYLGYVEWMAGVSRSITSRKPYSTEHRDNLTSSLEGICRRLDTIVPEKNIPLYEDDEDLDVLNWIEPSR
ncbi:MULTISPECIES: P-loop NTPase [unclassified Oceanispirochaeta]|uniref:P-loop NTPase n=1 Tax=unclassified Oceanispirochaeta TaxID=2635722 RepID=UPI000E08DBC9|nr:MULTISPECIES: P-loop NTPase [unclassified Oceanispirochaeta]MBF9016257.1 P-loop NTPase [Oceanispirochaeta sp. M2]NPD72719.1 P-loop NTPase [Oceanispirochaeta sp. M1]RDG31866.1 MinD/ParA family protein [Oceanispirochaeta sp. M1]